MDQQTEAAIAKLEPKELAVLADLSSLRDALRKSHAECHQLMDDNAVVTARLEEALKTADQLRADLNASLAREHAAAETAGALRGVLTGHIASARHVLGMADTGMLGGEA